MPKRKLAEKGVDEIGAFVGTVIKAFESAKNPEKAAGMSKYMRNLFHYLGLTAPVRTKLQQPLFKESPFETEKDVLSAAQRLWALPEREYQYCALELCSKHKMLLTPAAFPVFSKFVGIKSWWDTVDSCASNCIGDLVFRYPALHANMDAWVTDKCMWRRRSSLIYQLKFKDNTDLCRLTNNATALLHEDEFFIQKAIGWSLRQVSKSNKPFVREFLSKHSSEMSTVARREAKKYV